MRQRFKSRLLNLGLLFVGVFVTILATPKVIEWMVNRSYLDGGLYASVQENDISEVKRLLALGTNPNAKNDQGEATLTLAKRLKQDEIAKILKAAGATDR